MSKDWEYAALGETERLDLIKSGNNDVYTSEKSRNASLKKLKSSLGLSTEDVDTWDSMIESARAQSKAPQGLTERDVSSLTGPAKDRVSYLLNAELDYQKKKANSETENAVDKAEKELEKLAEWLANNGFSVNGKTAKHGKDEIKRELAKALDMIETEYKYRSAQALASTISKF